jgi:hypothetical protein
MKWMNKKVWLLYLKALMRSPEEQARSCGFCEKSARKTTFINH